MEILFEIIFETIVGGSFDLSNDSSVPKPLRIFLGVFSMTIFLSILGLLIVIGFKLLFSSEKNSTLCGLLMLLISSILVFGLIYRMIKAKKSKK